MSRPQYVRCSWHESATHERLIDRPFYCSRNQIAGCDPMRHVPCSQTAALIPCEPLSSESELRWDQRKVFPPRNRVERVTEQAKSTREMCFDTRGTCSDTRGTCF